jgi:hypothetical protein
LDVLRSFLLFREDDRMVRLGACVRGIHVVPRSSASARAMVASTMADSAQSRAVDREINRFGGIQLRVIGALEVAFGPVPLALGAKVQGLKLNNEFDEDYGNSVKWLSMAVRRSCHFDWMFAFAVNDVLGPLRTVGQVAELL